MTTVSDCRVRILGTPISLVSMEAVLGQLERWAVEKRGYFVVLRDVHGVMLARRNFELRRAHCSSDLVAPDGMPLVWAARLARHRGISRVAGPDLLLEACGHGLSLGWRHYFYGGAPGVAERLAEALRCRFPGIKIVGTQSPPFRAVNQEEDEIACAAIRAACPQLVWVGLGTPKQEIWMFEHRDRCGGAILLGVGAAFDFYAGSVRRAPVWMQKFCLEWAYRFAQEPARLWKRYLVLGPTFVFLESVELMRRKLGRL